MRQEALLFIAWSRVFSPVVDDTLRKEAWLQLDLPGDFEKTQPTFWSTFHVGLPQPPATLLIHALLGVDGGMLREDIVRILEHLELDWGERRLAPDHLSCVLELLGVAIEGDEPVLVNGLRDRYLFPWCTKAAECVQGLAGIADTVDRLQADLSSGFTVI